MRSIPRSLALPTLFALLAASGLVVVTRVLSIDGAAMTVESSPLATSGDTGHSGDPANPAGPRDPAALIEEAPADAPHARAAPAPVAAPSVEEAPPPEPWVEPGTPAIYCSTYYLAGHVPAEIHADGTQVYEFVPVRVRRGDGTFEVQHSTFRIQPTDALPILSEVPGTAPKQP